jgi:hypothetical protein
MFHRFKTLGSRLLAAWCLFHVVASLADSLPDFESDRILLGPPSVYARLRRVVVRPFATYLDAIGVHQRWRMFVEPSSEASTFQIVGIAADGAKTVLYETGSESATWARARFEDAAMRKMITRWKSRDQIGAFTTGCRGIALAAMTDFPECEGVECRYQLVGKHDPVRSRVVTRGTLRESER